MVTVNTLQPMYLAKALIDQLVERAHPSAIVVTSSGLGLVPIAGCIAYSCTKSFAGFLAEGLAWELKEKKIDCLAWYCGEVSTNMLKRPVGGRVVSTNTAVNGMLRDLGKETTTFGCTKHARSMSMFGVMPLSIV